MDSIETLLICGIVALAAIIGVVVFRLTRKKNAAVDKWVSTEDFERRANQLSRRCGEEELGAFLDFLREYGGGYVRREHGKIVKQEFLGREKGALKGIFFHVIVPDPNLTISKKEEFRQYLRTVGVTGIERRPDYAERDSALRNPEQDSCKEVGNKGEEIVRGALLLLRLYNYKLINGAKLLTDGTVREFDHIVIGNGGVFLIETKAFGMTNGKAAEGVLKIGKDDSWTLNRGGRIRALDSPTEQIVTGTEHLRKIIRSCPAEIHAIAALSNTGLQIVQEGSLPYAVVRADQLTQAILASKDRLTDTDVNLIACDIDAARIN